MRLLIVDAIVSFYKEVTATRLLIVDANISFYKEDAAMRLEHDD